MRHLKSLANTFSEYLKQILSLLLLPQRWSIATLDGPFLSYATSWLTWTKTLFMDFWFPLSHPHRPRMWSWFPIFSWTGRLIWHIVRNVIPVRNARVLADRWSFIPNSFFRWSISPATPTICERSLVLNRDTNLLSSSDKNMAPISHLTL